MIKAFLRHSSIQKNIIRRVVLLFFFKRESNKIVFKNDKSKKTNKVLTTQINESHLLDFESKDTEENTL